MNSADEILQRVAQTYATCRSYRDIGEVAEVSIRGEHPWQRVTTRKPFQTAFVRPERLLFEFREMGVGPSEEWPHYAVWCNASGVHSWTTMTANAEPRRTEHGTLHDALLLPSSLSGGSTLRVPALLGLPPGGPQPLCEGCALENAGVDDVDGRTCWRLQGRRFGEPLALWIDQRRFLLVRYFERRHFTPESERLRYELLLADPALPVDVRALLEATPPALERAWSTESTTFYRPEVEVDIDAAVFEVQPPQ